MLRRLQSIWQRDLLQLAVADAGVAPGAGSSLIALDVGYESEAAFSRAFKRMVSIPPAAWRKAQADA